jgi:hypothetical protein
MKTRRNLFTVTPALTALFIALFAGAFAACSPDWIKGVSDGGSFSGGVNQTNESVPNDEPAISGEVNFPEGSLQGAVTFSVKWPEAYPASLSNGPVKSAQGALSVSGVSTGDIKSAKAGLRNIYQLIVVDDSSRDVVHNFDEVRLGVPPNTLTSPVTKGHTYHFLFLAGHLDNPSAPLGPGNQPTLLVSGYVEKTMPVDANADKLSVSMTPLVVDTAFVKNGGGKELRQTGRLAKTVGLDENTKYTFRVVFGSGETGVEAPDDALKVVKGDGLVSLTKAETGVKGGLNHWGDLSLRTNKAHFGATVIGDYNDANKAPESANAHTTTGTAEYILTTQAASAATADVYFKMEYAPFGLDDSAWAARYPSTAPIWVIRNGLNDTDGAISTGVIPAGGVAAQEYGIFEDNNPWSLPGTGMDGWKDDLAKALGYLNTLLGDASVAARAGYGIYSIKLKELPDAPLDIKLGESPYENIKNINLGVLTPDNVKLPDGVTVEAGSGSGSTYIPPEQGGGGGGGGGGGSGSGSVNGDNLVAGTKPPDPGSGQSGGDIDPGPDGSWSDSEGTVSIVTDPPGGTWKYNEWVKITIAAKPAFEIKSYKVEGTDADFENRSVPLRTTATTIDVKIKANTAITVKFARVFPLTFVTV